MTKKTKDREPKWQYHIKRLIKFLGERGSIVTGKQIGRAHV